MSDTTFVDYSSATPIVAAWLNDVNNAIYKKSAGYLPSPTGTNTLVGTSYVAITSLIVGMRYEFFMPSTNTGAVTLNINGLGAKAILKSGTTQLGAGDLPAGAAVVVLYDGTQFQLVSGAGGGAVGGGVFYENATTLAANYTITSGKNAMMVGPLSVATGVTLTIPTGSRLVVL